VGIELLVPVLAALASLLAGKLLSSNFGQWLNQRFLHRPEAPAKPYSERLAELTAVLTRSSRELDAVLNELGEVARERSAALQQLEDDLLKSERREKEARDRIEALEKIPLPVAEHFAKLTQAGEQRSAKRDYLLFGAGVVVSTVIGLIIQLSLGGP
jgi:hypothetical protein